ncbi:hypothetical protein INT48_000364 [Thamnidium elegans]|uniref:Uncharacterized protein n=1 Tax=Thamnidium elegans TaxID=101142 RepID=A0A8H7VXF0_9FUNG|nr:hypothetical protein INT48_000364 [Thamnidium elegans]
MNAIKRLESNERQKDSFKNIFKEKADILLLKKGLESRLKWPWKPVNYSGTNLPRVDSTSKNKESEAPKLHKHISLQEIDDKTSYEMSDLVGGFLFQNCKNVDTTNIALPVSENEAELDWEYVMGNMFKLGLPQTVIDRVKKRMEEEANKSSSAITAMNVTRPLLSDLTITTAEVEMQQEIQKLVSENELYESRPEDEPFEDSIKWLIDLDRKDQYSKDKEIEKIHLDYTGFLNK